MTPAQRDRWLPHMMAAVDTLDLPPANDLLLRDYLERAAHSMVNTSRTHGANVRCCISQDFASKTGLSFSRGRWGSMVCP